MVWNILSRSKAIYWSITNLRRLLPLLYTIREVFLCHPAATDARTLLPGDFLEWCTLQQQTISKLLSSIVASFTPRLITNINVNLPNNQTTTATKAHKLHPSVLSTSTKQKNFLRTTRMSTIIETSTPYDRRYTPAEICQHGVYMQQCSHNLPLHTSQKES